MDKLTCIVVDDEVHVAQRMVSLLKKSELVEVLEVVNVPEDAVNRILDLKPDLTFVDVEMPRMSGFDVIHEVRKFNSRHQFVFVTAYSQYAIKAIKSEAFDYILKPVDLDELHETLERYLNKKSCLADMDVLPIECDVLSNREKEVLKLVWKGKTSKIIADELFLSKATVDTHRRNILEKTGVRNLMELMGKMAGK